MTDRHLIPPKPVEAMGPLPFKPRRPRVLMLTHRVPYPPDRGDRIRSYHLLRELSRTCDVSLAAVSDEPVTPEQHTALSPITRRMKIESISPAWSRARAAAALLSNRPLTPTMLFRRRLADTIVNWRKQTPFDAVVTFCSGMIEYTRALLESGGRHNARHTPHRTRHILDLVDVDSAKWARYANETAGPMRWVYAAEAKRLRQVEAGQYTAFDAVTVVSEAEARRYGERLGELDQLHVVSNGVDLDYFHPLPPGEGRTLVFTGVLDYKPNIDALCFFAHEVMPALRTLVKGARLLVVGRRPTHAINELDGLHGVEVIGPVDDVRPYLAKATAAIAPLRFAPGVQNKVLEAMACARPVVCSTPAARGIHANIGSDLLTADQPMDYISQIEKLMADEPFRRKVGESARRCVEQHYAWDKALAPMVELVTGKKRIQPFTFKRAA